MLTKVTYTHTNVSPGRECSLFPEGTSRGIRRMPGWNVSAYATIDSTNLEARRRLSAGLSDKQVIIADSQTMGQCRHDRLWESKAGRGLWASFVLPVAVPFSVLAQSTLVLAVAVREGVRNATGVRLDAKWPNDLLHGGKKCCGMLVESGEIVPHAETHSLILGVGVNTNHTATDFPAGLRGTATSLSIISGGKTFSCEDLAALIAQSIETWFARWEKEGFTPIRHAWLNGNCTIGNRVILPEGYGYSHATAHDLDKSGALVALADDGTALLIGSGEIRFTNATLFP